MGRSLLASGLMLTALLTTAACSVNSTSDSTPLTTTALSTPYTLKSGGNMPRYQQGLTIEHAALAFSFDFEHEILFGETTLTLSNPLPAEALSVDLDTVYRIDGVWLNNTAVAPAHYSNKQGELIITPAEPLRYPLTLKIAYHGHPRTPPKAPWDGGVMWETTPDGAPWLATAVQGEGCDIFWPCIDHPTGEPKRADLYITVPDGLVAASNGKLINTTRANGQTTFHWQTQSSHNTYGIALNVAPYEKLEDTYHSIYGNSYPIVYYHLPGHSGEARQLFDEIPPMLTFFEQMIGPYPFADEKVGVVQTPHLGMEHQTINAYGNEYKKDESGFDWLLQHEFAHEYFGNQVTNDNWDHMWIHEGLGTYMQPLYAQYLHGDLAYHVSLNQQRKSLSNIHPLVSGKIKEVSQVYEADTGPALDIYYKGSWIMHTLRYLIGDDAFFSSVKELLYDTTAPQPGNFSTVYRNTQDFINLVNKHAGSDLNWFFNVYLYQEKLPELMQVRRDNQLTLTWLTPEDLPFPMPVEVSVNGKITTLSMPAQNTLTVTDKDIVIIDPASKLLRFEKRYAALKKSSH